jgi:signal transduction histidine kinase
MFDQARLKLTIFYLIIIMFISGLFSLVVYRLTTQEFDRIERMNRQRMEDDDFFIKLQTPDRKIIFISPELIDESKQRLQLMLIVLNAGILSFSAIGGYYLAGRTLRPIKEMLDQQNQFITDASHELKTPLTALKTEIEVSLRDQKMTLREAKNLLYSNLEEVNSLQNLSESLIKLSQNNSAIPSDFQEIINIKDESDQAVKKVTPLAKKKKIQIENNIQSEFIKAIKNNFTELITIFLDNAIKYSPVKTTISLQSKKSDGVVNISISDQGIGIPKSEQSQIFNRFYRSDLSRSKLQSDGYGLGLSIAQKIVSSLHGKIEIESVENKGTTFIISLPRIKEL